MKLVVGWGQMADMLEVVALAEYLYIFLAADGLVGEACVPQGINRHRGSHSRAVSKH